MQPHSPPRSPKPKPNAATTVKEMEAELERQTILGNSERCLVLEDTIRRENQRVLSASLGKVWSPTH